MKHDRTGDLAQAVAAFACSDVRPGASTLERAKLVFADTLSATVAGATSDVLGPLRAYLESQPSLAPDKVVLGTNIKSSPELAALVNGTQAAALEFDDVLSIMPAHPSAVVVAALMACEDGLNASGEEVLVAYAVGVEAGARIAQAITLDHYKRGFHATGTIALFSAVVALARIQGLSEEMTRRSLGLAASMSSGVQGNFGTMTKPLHSGWAARNALAAVSMATCGLTANESIFEAEGGYFAAYGSDNSHADRMPNAFGQPWIFDEPGVTLKLFPCCYANHRGMDALRQLMANFQVGPNEVAHIRCDVPPGGLIPLKFDRPRTHFESLFSFPHALAVTALDGMPGLKSFSQERVVADDVTRMLERIEVVESESCVAAHPDYNSKSYGSRGEVRVTLETTDGRADSVTVVYAPGHPLRPMTWEQAQGKFEGCLDAAGLSTEQAQRAFADVRNLEKLTHFHSLVNQLTLNEE